MDLEQEGPIVPEVAVNRVVVHEVVCIVEDRYVIVYFDPLENVGRRLA